MAAIGYDPAALGRYIDRVRARFDEWRRNEAFSPLPRREQDDPNYNIYQLGDGTWIALGMTLHPHKYWPALCNALGRPELIDDPCFVDVEKRRENFRELIDIYDAAFAELTWEQWDEKIHEYELISCRVNSLTDLASDEQILVNGYMQKLPHPDLGEWWYVPTPVQFEKTPISISTLV